MKPAPFAYARAEGIDEAVALLARHGDEAAVLAGGQSLVPMLALRLTRPRLLVDINRIPGLDRLAITTDAIEVGALVRHADLLARLGAEWPRHLLAQALPHVAHAGVRNRGTICGSLALADPAAELPACALCLDAVLTLQGPAGSRELGAADFFQGTYATLRQDDELITAVRFPQPPPGSRMALVEVARRHGDYAIIGLAVRLTLAEDRIRAARLVFFGGTDGAVRAPAAEAALLGQHPADQAGTARAAVLASEELELAPAATVPEAYRRRLASALVARALRQIADGEGA